jgi:hypothetical protein
MVVTSQKVYFYFVRLGGRSGKDENRASDRGPCADLDDGRCRLGDIDSYYGYPERLVYEHFKEAAVRINNLHLESKRFGSVENPYI